MCLVCVRYECDSGFSPSDLAVADERREKIFFNLVLRFRDLYWHTCGDHNSCFYYQQDLDARSAYT